MRTKKCPRCAEQKPVGAFAVDRGRKTGLQSYCRPCQAGTARAIREADIEKYRAKSRAWYHAHPKSWWGIRLTQRYGLSLDDYDRMLISQSGRCLVCGNDFKHSRDSNVDHCHKTGRVRGILCTACNSGIGYFRDDPTIMESAITYLRRTTP